MATTTPPNPESPLVNQHFVGLALGLRWKAARQLLERAGVHVVEQTNRKWHVRREDWNAFLVQHRLAVPA